MAYQLFTEADPLTIENIVVIIFGEPGIGKTSLTYTANKPLVEDFDGGSQRAVGRKATLRLESWEDAVKFHNSGDIEKHGIKTLIFDTAGTMLDNYITHQVIKDDEKNAKKDGSLAIGGYGAMKNVFNAFVNKMQMFGLDLIFICHDDDEKNKEEIKKKPKVTGGSYDILKQKADLIGYMETDGNKRVIDFNPCDRHVGKNSAQIEKQVVPEYTEPEFKDFMARLIQKAKDKMNEMSEEQEQAVKLVDQSREQIENAEDIAQIDGIYAAIEVMSPIFKVQLEKVFVNKYMTFFNEALSQVKYTVELDLVVEIAKEAPEVVKGELRKALANKAKALNFKFDQSLGIYVGPEGKPTDPENDQSVSDDSPENENKPENEAKDTSDKDKPADNKKKSGTAGKMITAGKKDNATQSEMNM